MTNFLAGIQVGMTICINSMYFWDGDLGKPSTFIVWFATFISVAECFVLWDKSR